MRELFRTDEGYAAWKSPATDVEARRLLGALIQPQPEQHLRLVLGGDGEILLESLVRRGWVAWREKVAELQIAAIETTLANSGDVSQKVETVITVSPEAAKAPAWPPVKSAPSVSSQEIQDSLDEFFRRMGK